MTEFNLSEQLENLVGFGLGSPNPQYLHIDKVKEFIRLLKENLECKFDKKRLKFIDKLAGDKLK